MAALSLVAIFTGAYSIWQIDNRPDNGYYTYEDQNYYYYHGNWYEWENDSWRYAPDESWMESDYESYYDSYSYDSGAEYDNFRILLTTVPMMTAVMTVTGTMTAGIPDGIPMTVGTQDTMTGALTGKM